MCSASPRRASQHGVAGLGGGLGLCRQRCGQCPVLASRHNVVVRYIQGHQTQGRPCTAPHRGTFTSASARATTTTTAAAADTAMPFEVGHGGVVVCLRPNRFVDIIPYLRKISWQNTTFKETRPPTAKLADVLIPIPTARARAATAVKLALKRFRLSETYRENGRLQCTTLT